MVLVALEEKLDGLERADVAGDEAEDGDADAALDEDAEVGKLEEDGVLALGGRGPEEVCEPAGNNVLNDD